MARWLCRLQPGDLQAAPEAFLGAGALGVCGWVLTGLSPDQLALGPEHWLAFLNQGALFVLDVDATTSAAEQVECWSDLLTPWLEHPQAVQWKDQPLLFWRGLAPAEAPRSASVFVVQGPAQPTIEDVWGVVEHVPAIPTDYRRFLQHAHARRAPSGDLIPAVRALSASELSYWSYASAEAYGEWLQLSNATSDLLYPDGSGVVVLESWDGHRGWFAAAEPTEEQLFPQPVLPTLLRAWGTPKANHWALLVHGYYLDCLEKMLEPLLPQQDGDGDAPGLDLYVSTPIAQLPQTALFLRRLGWKRVKLFGVENRGRDIAPFLLQLLPEVIAHGHQFFVKVHTKKSPHLAEGGAWADHLIQSLLMPEALKICQGVLMGEDSVGVVSPAGTLVPLSLHLDRNHPFVKSYQADYGLDGCWMLDQNYVAGSMMAGRLQAIAPWQHLISSLCQFEREQGQTDGTVAHGLERVLCLDLQRRGWRLCELDGDAGAVPSFGFRHLNFASEID